MKAWNGYFIWRKAGASPSNMLLVILRGKADIQIESGRFCGRIKNRPRVPRLFLPRVSWSFTENFLEVSHNVLFSGAKNVMIQARQDLEEKKPWRISVNQPKESKSI